MSKTSKQTLEREHLSLLQRQMAKAHKLRGKDEQPLTVDQRRTIVETFRRLLDGLYVHLPQKRAAYGFDPSQRLRLLGERATDLRLPDAIFHRELAQIFTDLRDAHTRYLAPQVYENEAYFLPILIERFVDNEGPHYVASKVKGLGKSEISRFVKAGFVDGVELKYWNGVPIARAVELYAVSETGGRPDARLARALESLTIRPLRYALPPDEEWVDVQFTTIDNSTGNVRLEWEIAELVSESEPTVGSSGQALAYNPIADRARQVKKMLFAGEVWVAEQRQASRRDSKSRNTSAALAVKRKEATISAVQMSVDSGWAQQRSRPLTGKFGASVYARQIKLKDKPFGYLRIHSFQVNNDQAFIEEIVELIEQMPRTGLIVDIRSNPGGNIWAAEGLLQLFTPNVIEPTRFSVLATDMTRAMAMAPQNRNMTPWAGSLRDVLTTGVSYSCSEPLTPPARCNNIGQRYSGPVIAIVDANTYSAGELFAAGFVDNHIGKLICTDQATGGGGANVWTEETVRAALKGTEFELADLGDVSFTISARRAERIGAHSREIEDTGVEAVFRRPLTKVDLVDKNRDLLDYACRHLANEMISDIDYKIISRTGDNNRTIYSLDVKTIGLSQLRIKYDGMTRTIGDTLDPGPTASGRVKQGQQILELESDWTQHRVELMGYDRTTLRQRRLIIPG